MSAGRKLSFTIVIVLSDTEDVLSGVTRDNGSVGVVAGMVVVAGGTGAVAGCAGDESRHPPAVTPRRTMRMNTGTLLMHAGQSCPYKKVMVIRIGRVFS